MERNSGDLTAIFRGYDRLDWDPGFCYKGLSENNRSENNRFVFFGFFVTRTKQRRSCGQGRVSSGLPRIGVNPPVLINSRLSLNVRGWTVVTDAKAGLGRRRIETHIERETGGERER